MSDDTKKLADLIEDQKHREASLKPVATIEFAEIERRVVAYLASPAAVNAQRIYDDFSLLVDAPLPPYSRADVEVSTRAMRRVAKTLTFTQRYGEPSPSVKVPLYTFHPREEDIDFACDVIRRQFGRWS